MPTANALRDIRGIVGAVVDLARIARHDFSNPHGYTKFLILRALARRTGAKTFLEAGTYHGVTADRCAVVFERVLTVELDPSLAREARKALAHRANVELVEGDATEWIPRLVARHDVNDVLISLDAHFCGEGTAHGEVPEPAVQELESLAPHAHKIRAIVIDDFRSFGAEKGFPPKWQVVRAAETLFGPHGFTVSVYLDQLVIEAAPGR